MRQWVKRYAKPFLLGMLCFLVAQPMLRIPLLNLLQQRTDVALRYMLYPMQMLFLLSFSAGLFEETFRHLFRRFFFRQTPHTWREPVLFGLGHGVFEALYFLLPALQYVSLSSMGPALIERLFAIIIQIGLTVMVWNGFQKKRPIRYLLLAIAAHGAVNFIAVSMQASGYTIYTVEGAIGIMAVLFLMYTLRSRENYPEGDYDE